MYVFRSDVTNNLHHDDASFFSIQPGESIKECLFNAIYYFYELCHLGLPNTPLMNRLLHTVVDKRFKILSHTFGDHNKLACIVMSARATSTGNARIDFKVLHKESLEEYTCYVDRVTDDLHVESFAILTEMPSYVTDDVKCRIKYL